jgi:hypothetical protein
VFSLFLTEIAYRNSRPKFSSTETLHRNVKQKDGAARKTAPRERRRRAKDGAARKTAPQKARHNSVRMRRKETAQRRKTLLHMKDGALKTLRQRRRHVPKTPKMPKMAPYGALQVAAWITQI